MLSFLLLASSTGQPVHDEAAARCARLPVHELTFVPTASTTWRSADGHLLLALWATEPRWWHVGDHGVTAVTGHPWSVSGPADAPSGPAFALTEAIGAADGLPSGLTADEVVVRLRPDGSGFAAAAGLGGALHVVEGDGVVAVSDRAGLAATGVGASARRTDLPGLVRGHLGRDQSAYRGVERLRPGTRVVTRGRLGSERVTGPGPAGLDGGGDVTEARSAAVADLTRLVELAAARPGERWLELGTDPGSRVLAAAVAATGTTPRFRVRPRTPNEAEAVAPLAAALGVQLESARGVAPGSEALDLRVRQAVARTEGAVAATAATGGPLGQVVAPQGGLLLAAVPGGPLVPTTGVSGRGLLTSQAWAVLDGDERAWEAGLGRTTVDAAVRELRAELELRAPARRTAARALAAGNDLLDPTAVPSVQRLAFAAAVAGQDPVEQLVAALHPPLSGTATPGGEARHVPPDQAWRAVAPVVEALALGHARDALAATVDLDRVTEVVRSSTMPDVDTLGGLEGVLALAVWAGGLDVHTPARPAPVVVSAPVETPDQVPTLVTGITSASLLKLARLAVPLQAQEEDPLLGVTVDREVRDLTLRILLAAGATPGHLPEDLDARLSGPDTAHLAVDARALLARRGGTLADPRLAFTLPFWHAHVAAPRVVLVAERPPDLSHRSPARLPRRTLLAWWIDAVAAAAATGTDVHVVDPADLQDLGQQEASGWDGLGEDGHDTPDLVRVARTVDSLVREIELDAARPLLRTVRRARAATPVTARQVEAASAPLRVVDDLWERAVAADERTTALRAELDAATGTIGELTSALEELRGRRGWKAAWSVLVGRDEE